ncbi:MAG: hypothetical protein GWP08_04495 [Nitrospiraceae bacterium]|nr:hypothetical protein [Nitrospiraceae bacterium]
MTDARPSEARAHEFEEVVPSGHSPSESLTIEDLDSVRLYLTADLGRSQMSVREVLDLKQGSIVQLDKLAGEMTDIFVNDVPLARADVVVIADGLHLRIAEVVGAVDIEPAGDDNVL